MKGSRRFSAKALVVVCVLTLVLCCAVGGTIAWLTDQTQTVVNTFTYGDIDITLTENDTNMDGDNNPNTNKYKMMPGSDISKNPTVTVKAGSEACYLFVKLEKSANFDQFMTFEIAEGWSPLAGQPGVYYRELAAVSADTAIAVLKDNKVSVLNSVTKNMMNELDKEGAAVTYPTLSVTAYAVQKDNVADAATAWSHIQ